MFSDLEINGGEGYVPYVSQDPLNDPKSFTFRIKVRELGTPTMPLPNPDMATKKATFGMS